MRAVDTAPTITATRRTIEGFTDLILPRSELQREPCYRERSECGKHPQDMGAVATRAPQRPSRPKLGEPGLGDR